MKVMNDALNRIAATKFELVSNPIVGQKGSMNQRCKWLSSVA